ncbi:MAG: 2,3-epoxybenzoyl-CoA dihydrolase [Cytophagales bacterium]|nr:2,3-epoxybenzoyl-CoA dihydrolase [Cytophagales bacterium]
MTTAPHTLVDYRTSPDQYQHWSYQVEGSVATLCLNINEDAGIRSGYKLKLNSYDLGVDIELHDALQRIRFCHPEVACVVVTSGKERIFCSGANIFMLGLSSHAWKVNFCKFTNETRNGIEDSSRYDGLTFLAAVNGACAGGGYELALACDEIYLVDDRSSAVSLPEVPLLGVLPGTGGLTRVTDKRKVRHDLADIFCTSVEGVRGQRAKDWRLVDEVIKTADFQAGIAKRAAELAATAGRVSATDVGTSKGIEWTRVERDLSADGNTLHYQTVQVSIDRAKRTVSLTVLAPTSAQPTSTAQIEAAGVTWWPLQLARELDDAILHLRTNEPEMGLWLLKSKGDAASVLACDAALIANKSHWLVRATIGHLRRTFSRIDVSSRSLFAVIEEGSCFVGSLLEIALAADRSYMYCEQGSASNPHITVNECNFGMFPMATDQSRLERRFYEELPAIHAVKATSGKALDGAAAMQLGLVTAAPDDIDWADEVRLACEERIALSPDSLTGLEANLRFNGKETMVTRVFGRLSAWQNWIFVRPNASGERGALKLYGKGEKAQFDMNRV